MTPASSPSHPPPPPTPFPRRFPSAQLATDAEVCGVLFIGFQVCTCPKVPVCRSRRPSANLPPHGITSAKPWLLIGKEIREGGFFFQIAFHSNAVNAPLRRPPTPSSTTFWGKRIPICGVRRVSFSARGADDLVLNVLGLQSWYPCGHPGLTRDASTFSAPSSPSTRISPSFWWAFLNKGGVLESPKILGSGSRSLQAGVSVLALVAEVLCSSSREEGVGILTTSND